MRLLDASPGEGLVLSYAVLLKSDTESSSSGSLAAALSSDSGDVADGEKE